MNQGKDDRHVKKRFNSNVLVPIVKEGSYTTINSIESGMGSVGNIGGDCCKGQVKIILVVVIAIFEDADFIASCSSLPIWDIVEFYFRQFLF